MTRAFKACGCGATYTAAAWLALDRVGRMADGLGGHLSLRNCGCGSTLAVDEDVEALCSELEEP